MNIAIASGKGGTGKTTLAVNLASFIQNNANDTNEIVLVDLDVEEPNSGLFLNLELVIEEEKFRQVPQWIEDKCTLCGKCKSVCQLNAIAQLPNTLLIYPELCHSCYACSELCPEQALPMVDRKIGILKHYRHRNPTDSETGFSFIESILNVGEPSAVPLIKKTKEYIDEIFPKKNIKIFDCPPGTSCPVIEAVKDADFVILVTEPTPFGLHDLKLAVETMKKLDRRFGVVINRYGIGNKSVEEYCSNEYIQILAKIPNDKKIAKQYSRGELIYHGYPEIEKQLENIIKNVLELTGSENIISKNSNSNKAHIKQIIESFNNCHN